MNHSQSDSELSDCFDADDSETSSSSSSASSASTCSSSHSDDEEDEAQEDSLELAKVGKTLLRLPRGLCENAEIFHEFFSLQTWHMLPEELQAQLLLLLPQFTTQLEPNEAANEQQRTLGMLFNHELQRFGSTPLETLQRQLEAGHYRPDVVKLRQSIQKSRQRERRFQTCERLSHFARELFVSRERLLRSAYKSAPDDQPPPPSVEQRQLYADTKLCAVRARTRFAQEMQSLIRQSGLQPSDLCDKMEQDADCIEEDNTFKPQAPSNNPIEKCIYSTLFKRRAELNDEDALRAQQHAKQPRLSQRNFRHYLLAHKRRKLTEPNQPEFEIADIRLRDVCSRAQLGGNFKRLFASGKILGRKTKNNNNNNINNQSKSNSEPPALVPIEQQPTPVHQEATKEMQQQAAQTNGILALPQASTPFIYLAPGTEEAPDEAFDLMDGEVELQQEEVATYTCEEETIPAFVIGNDAQTKQFEQLAVMPKLAPLPPPPVSDQQQLVQETHACFFSLVRDFFCATPHHRIQLSELRHRIDQWLSNPITGLNVWYTLVDNWSAALKSAIDFLAGDFVVLPEEYVPFIEYKSQMNIYQWIGAGRDSDARLSALCSYWIQRRQTPVTRPTAMPTKVTSKVPPDAATSSTTVTVMELADAPTVTENPNEILLPPPPPPRFPTNWTVRAASADEVAEFQRQERERFEMPHRAYTYRLHGYESVVGPVKGVYSQIFALTKARGHSMMVGDRPNFVTILTLVRDATARLPNGEGTRADISELLKCSQYINRSAAENVLQTIVSGALDRMHTEHDPCVRYDAKRKIWIYLHRNRSEEEFERIHQQQQGLGKHKKPTTASTRKQQKFKVTTTTNNNNNNININHMNNTEADSVSITPSVDNAQASLTPLPLPLPALVPANPITLLSSQQQQQQLQIKQQQALLRCPPVPPLKYHVPLATHTQQQQQQQQKSLLKTTRLVESGNVNVNLPENQRILVRTLSAASTPAKKQQQQQQQQLLQQQQQGNVSFARTLNAKLPGTPILVATSSGLQTVHMSNASAVASSATTTATGSAGVIVTPTTLSATVGGKKVALNKPIIINQITTSSNYQHQQHLLQQQQKQQQQQQQQQQIVNSATLIKSKTFKQLPQQSNQISNKQQQQQQGYIIPISDSVVVSPTNVATTMLVSSFKEKHQQQQQPLQHQQQQQQRNVQAMFIDNGQLISPSTTADTVIIKQQQPKFKQQHQTKNIIRIVPATKSLQTTTSTSTSATVLQQQKIVKSISTPVPIVRQVQSQNQQKTGAAAITTTSATTIGGISIITASGNAAGGGAIVKMTPQAFAALQQQQKQQLLLKSTGTTNLKPIATNIDVQKQTHQQQPRLIVGNTAIITGQQQQQPQQQMGSKNLIHATLQPIASSVSSSTTTTTTTTATTTTAAINSLGSHNATTGAIVVGNIKNRLQTITATNLSPQQQRILLQNLKQQKQQLYEQQLQQPQQQQQQQQMLNQRLLQQQQQQHLTSSTVTKTLKSPQQLQQPQQQQTVTRFLKTMPIEQQSTSTTISTATVTTAAATAAPTTTTRVLANAAGQIISLESLLQRQQQTRIIAKPQDKVTTALPQIMQLTGGSRQVSLSSQQQQQQQQQYGVVVSQSPRGLISLATTSTAATSTQRLLTTMSVAATTTTSPIKSVDKPEIAAKTLTTGTRLAVGSPTTTTKLFGKATVLTTMGSGSPGSRGNTLQQNAGSNIRIINTSVGGNGTPLAGFNIANIQGKQVVFATKQSPISTNQSLSQQQLLQNAGVVIGGQTMKLQNNNTLSKSGALTSQTSGSGAAGGTQLQTVIMGNQILRLQQLPAQTQTFKTAGGTVSGTLNRLTLPLAKSTTTSSSALTASTTTTLGNTANSSDSGASNATTTLINARNVGNLPKTLVLGGTGQTMRLQAAPKLSTVKGLVTANVQQQQQQQITSMTVGAKSTTTSTGMPPTSRVVLAVQSGAPIFLSPSNFQGGTINLKTLQHMKVVSLASSSTSPSPSTTTSTAPTVKLQPQATSTQQQL